MNSYAALLRAVNVGGTGKLPMAELRSLCDGCGFLQVTTYIQSGNVVFRSKLTQSRVKQTLEQALTRKMGSPAQVLIRTLEELQAVVKDNPFPGAAPSQVLVLFLEKAPASNSLDDTPVPGREQLVLRGREIFIHFPEGMGRSKLKPPFQKIGTGRNLNTTRKLVALLQKLVTDA